MRGFLVSGANSILPVPFCFYPVCVIPSITRFWCLKRLPELSTVDYGIRFFAQVFGRFVRLRRGGTGWNGYREGESRIGDFFNNCVHSMMTFEGRKKSNRSAHLSSDPRTLGRHLQVPWAGRRVKPFTRITHGNEMGSQLRDWNHVCSKIIPPRKCRI